jgi:hypothetical protein
MFQIYTMPSEVKSVSKTGYPVLTGIHPQTDNVIMRWGLSNNRNSEFKKVINPGAAIALNCDKPAALEMMSKVVSTPTRFKEEIPQGALAVLRPRSHCGGEGFNVVRGKRKIGDDSYATRFIKTKVEYRVWFAWGEMICARRVCPKNKKAGQYPCRSEWGYRFRKVPERLKTLVPIAAHAIGLETGAADILFKKNRFIFLELNSAPTIDDRRIANFYKHAIANGVKARFGIKVTPTP